ncbi:hypothetical protein ABMC88_13735 [Sulfitobacter sp. HNIBRBA2951]|uniref:hypothetical protein n=1 Tax=Sulfitobacter aquimarinus TaxID=3158557 RepID=UPI0032DE8A36
MRPLILAAAIATALPAIASAQTYRASNDLTVVPLTRSTFEVIESRGEGPRGMWCAAAEYSERKLGKFGRVYIAKARGASQTRDGRKAVTFTTNAASLSQGPSTSVSLSTRQVGVGLNTAHAIQFCRDYDRDVLRPLR